MVILHQNFVYITNIVVADLQTALKAI